jgi:hypothetical protein
MLVNIVYLILKNIFGVYEKDTRGENEIKTMPVLPWHPP